MLIRKFIFGRVCHALSQRFLNRFHYKNTYTKDLRVIRLRIFFMSASWGRAPARPKCHRGGEHFFNISAFTHYNPVFRADKGWKRSLESSENVKN